MSNTFDEESSRPASKWVAPAIAVLVIYVAIRLVNNFSSWKPEPLPLPNDSAEARSAGLTYGDMLADSAHPDSQIQTLWKLIQVSSWSLPENAKPEGAPALARQLQTRALNYYRANDLAQTTSYLKMLLRWSMLMLTATGAQDNHFQSPLGLALAQITLDAVQACPNALLHPEINKMLTDLETTIATESPSRRQSDLDGYLTFDFASSDSRRLFSGWKLLSNRLLLESMLTQYLEGKISPDRAHVRDLRWLQLKTWLYVCPLDTELFARSKLAIDEQRHLEQLLLSQIKKIRQLKPVLPSAVDPPMPVQ